MNNEDIKDHIKKLEMLLAHTSESKAHIRREKAEESNRVLRDTLRIQPCRHRPHEYTIKECVEMDRCICDCRQALKGEQEQEVDGENK